MDVAPPFIVSIPPECAFYRTVDAAVLAAGDGDVFDAHGCRLAASEHGVGVESVESAELAHVLRRWLGHSNVLGEATASWPLWLLVHAAVERGGYSD